MPYLTPDTPPTNEFVCRRLRIPASPGFLELVSGALSELTHWHNWEQFGTFSVEDTVQAFRAMFLDYAASSQPCISNPTVTAMIGTITPYITNSPPGGCLPCDGSQYSRVDFPDLYAALDAAFILDANTFITPDLRGRTVIGAGSGAGLTPRNVNASGGAESHTLTVAELPPHQHRLSTFPGSTTPAQSIVQYATQPYATGAARYTYAAGDGAAHNNMPPFVALKYCVVAVVA